MSPISGRTEKRPAKMGNNPTSPERRYFTRSTAAQLRSLQENNQPSDQASVPLIHSQRSPPLSRPPSVNSNREPSCTEAEAPQLDPLNVQSEPSLDIMDQLMDSAGYSPVKTPIRAPFPSPAIKSIQPLYSFPSTAQGQHPAHNGSGFPTHEKYRFHGGSILVEAANRAQIARLGEDMGSMVIEPMDQS
jgi:hypothetical protein